MREFLHVDDLADACLFLMHNYNEKDFVNIGAGKDISILALANLIKTIIGYKGEIVHDYTKPDGTPKKLMDVSKINQLGWTAKIKLNDGIKDVYEVFQQQYLQKETT